MLLLQSQPGAHRPSTGGHGYEPAEPAWGEVNGDHQVAVVDKDNHQSRAKAKGPSLAAEFRITEIHQQEDFDRKQKRYHTPVHVTACIIERHTCQLWRAH